MMPAKKIFVLPNSEKILFIETWIIVLKYRFIISLFPMRFYIDTLGQRGAESSYQKQTEKQDVLLMITESMRRAIKYLPGNTKCLPRALAFKKLLHRRGIASTLYLGVGKNDKKLVAHAWLRCGSEIITGAEEADRFTKMVSFS